jgi:hypothetical protein
LAAARGGEELSCGTSLLQVLLGRLLLIELGGELLARLNAQCLFQKAACLKFPLVRSQTTG